MSAEFTTHWDHLYESKSTDQNRTKLRYGMGEMDEFGCHKFPKLTKSQDKPLLGKSVSFTLSGKAQEE